MASAAPPHRQSALAAALAGKTRRCVRNVETAGGGAWWCSTCICRASSSSDSIIRRRRRRHNIDSLVPDPKGAATSTTTSATGLSESSSHSSLSSSPSSKQQQALAAMHMAAATSPFRFRLSPGRVSPLIDAHVVPSVHDHDRCRPLRCPHLLHSCNCPAKSPPAASPARAGKLGSLLLHRAAGFLQSAPPPPPQSENSKAAKSSPTLLEMMRTASESQLTLPASAAATTNSCSCSSQAADRVDGDLDVELLQRSLSLDLDHPQLQEENRIYSCSSPFGGCCRATRIFENTSFSCSNSDVKLILCSRGNATHLRLRAHSQVLASRSTFLAARLSSRSTPQDSSTIALQQLLISDCDDVGAYVETLRLMYCSDAALGKRLVRENVCRVLAILKVSASIAFDAGVAACLEYLEAAPWAEEEEEKVVCALSELKQTGRIGAASEVVLARLSTAAADGCPASGAVSRLYNDAEGGGLNVDEGDVVGRLLHLVVEGTDEKGRRQMKGMVSRLMKENKGGAEASKGSLYEACRRCVDCLLDLYRSAADSVAAAGGQKAAATEERSMLGAQIARCADSLRWLVDILTEGRIAEEFVETWALHTELPALHGRVPISMGRHEVSRLSGSLCMAIGQGQVLAPRDTRFALVQNWLQHIIDDFGWMQRTCRAFDRRCVEDGISRTISTLPLRHQQSIIMSWLARFLANGDDCPNLQTAFQIWWRRTFVRPPHI